MELGDCFPRGLSQIILMLVMVPPPITNWAETQAPSLQSCFQWKEPGPSFSVR